MTLAADFSPLFRTATGNGSDHARNYLLGLFQGQRGRKNMERMEEAVPDLNYQGVQQFISNSPWEADGVFAEVARQANGFLGGVSDSRLIIDCSGTSKKGVKSVGVDRLYNGSLGKVDNCQVAVFAALSAGRLATLIGTRLYLPESWCSSPARCLEAGIPEPQQCFRTKPELALELVREARARGVSFGITCADGGYGQFPSFLRALDDMQETFVVEVHCDQRIYADAPWPEEIAEGEEGAKPRRRKQNGGTAQRIDKWVESIPDTDWERLKVRDSTQGWVEVNYVARRMWVWDGKENRARIWWALAWQNPDEGPQGRIHYALSNAPADAVVSEVVKHGVHRFWVERSLQDAKSEAGLSDYQTRGWLGWHHHMSLVMLMMLFILKEKVLHNGTTHELPLSAGDIVLALSKLLPQRKMDFEEVCELVETRRRKRLVDQRRRRRKTALNRPPLGPLEI
jgi:SRSO17 transposase